MNERVAVLIPDAGRLLFVRRVKEGREYYVLPGGGVEAGETLEAACRREIEEETGLAVVLGEKLCSLVNRGRVEHYFVAAGFRGEPRLGGPERERQSATNQYRLEWVGPTAWNRSTSCPRRSGRSAARACAHARVDSLHLRGWQVRPRRCTQTFVPLSTSSTTSRGCP